MSVRIVLVPDQSLQPAIYSDQQIASLAAAITAWVATDVGPAYGEGWAHHYQVVPIPRGHPAPAGDAHTWVFALRQNSTIQGALGWHSTTQQGYPFGEIAVYDALASTMDPAAVLSHEVAETLVNRYVDACKLGAYQGRLVAWWMEACDPVERFNYPYAHGGASFQMSDFVLPSYWHEGGTSPFSHMGHAPAPFTPAPGGQQAYFDGTQFVTIGGATPVRTPATARPVHLGVHRP